MSTDYGTTFNYGSVSLINGNGPGTIASDTYSDKTVLVSFVDIDTGWDWVEKLTSLVGLSGYSSIDSDVKILIFTFKFDSPGSVYQSITRTDLDSKITTLDQTNISRLTFLLDGDGYCAAHEEASGHQDYWGCIVGTDGVVSGLNTNAVADKWGSTDGWGTLIDADGYPGISFSALDFETGTSLSKFDPGDDANLVAHLLERLKNLTSDPKVLCAKPTVDSWINGGFVAELYFSKPMHPGTTPSSQANDATKYLYTDSADHGAAWGSLTVSSATYLQGDNPTNKVSLALTGSPSDTDIDKTFTIPAIGIPDTYGVVGVVPATDPLPNPVPYLADITSPTISFTAPTDGAIITTSSVGITLSANDPPGGGVGTSSGVAGYYLQLGSGTLPADLSSIIWQSSGNFTQSLSTNGDYAFSAWAIDNAGNISQAPAQITISKVTPSISVSAPAVSYKKYSSGTILVSATIISTLPVKGWTITASATPGTIPANGGTIADAPYVFSGTAADGEHTLYLHAADQNDNIVTVSFPARKDTTNPVFTAGLTSNPVTNNPDINMRITSASDAGSGITGYYISLTAMPVDTTAWLIWDAANSWQTWNGTTPLDISHTLTTGNWGEKHLRIWVRDAAWNITEQVVPVNYRMRRDIMLALDFSGSMRGQVFFDYTGQDGLVAGDYSKYSVLKNAVGWFVDLLKAWDGPDGVRGINDTIGGYIFRDHLELLQASLPVYDGSTDGGDSLKSALESHAPPQSGQLTAMGAGIAKALLDMDYQDDDSTAGARRALLVITDGMQNRLPVLTVNEPASGTIDVTIDSANPGGINTYTSSGDSDETAEDVGGGNFAGTVHYRKDPVGDVSRNVQVNTLGIGDHEPWQQNLAKAALASRDEGEFLTDSNGYDGVNDFFQAALTRIYAGNTPQTILNEKGYFSTGREKEIIYNFDLNHTVSSLAIVLSWMGNTPLTMTIRNGSKTVNTRITPSSFSRIAVIDLPVSGGPRSVMTTGFRRDKIRYQKRWPIFPDSIYQPEIHGLFSDDEWSVSIRPAVVSTSENKGAVPYFMAVMAEEKALKLTWETAPAIISQGRKWKGVIRIEETGQLSLPVPSVAANLVGPAIHPGSVLGEISPGIIQELLNNPEDGTLLAQLRNRAAEDPHGALAKLVSQLDRKVSLPVKVTPVSAARYSGRLEVNVRIPERPGIYRINLVVTGRGKLCGSYRRVLSKSVIVPFKTDPEKTEVEPIRGGWIVTPKDINDMPLGPGGAALFRISKSESVEDKSNGSYVILSPGENREKAAEEILIGDVVITMKR